MSNKILCDVLIYTITREEFDKLVEKNKNDRYQYLRLLRNDEDFSTRISHDEYVKYSIWKYNQMIGFVEIEIENRDIVFNLYLSNEKIHRFFTNIKKYFTFVPTNALHFWTDGKTDKEIKRELYEFLQMIKEEFVNRKNVYLDTSTLDLLLENINLKKLIESR